MSNLESSTQSEDATVLDIPESSNARNSSPRHDAPVPVPAIHMTTSHVQLYQAVLGGKWKAAQTIIDARNIIVREPINSGSDYPLHIAVAGKDKGFVKNLLLKMEPGDLALKNNDDNTALHIAAALGVVEIAKLLVKKNESLTNITGGKNMIPIHLAALFGQGEMVKYLYTETNFDSRRDNNFINLFHAIISADVFDVALWMLNLKSNEGVELFSQNGIKDALHLMARKPSVISHNNQLNLFQKFAYFISKGLFFGKTKTQTFAHQLVERLWKSFKHSPDLPKLLFDAAESGNYEFLVILIRSNPDIIWITDDKNQSLFHIAALYRHKSIFELIYELGGIKNLIASHVDRNTKNNLLHLVARLPPPSRLQIVSGAALQMRRELLWFKAVKKIVPRSYIKEKNAKGDIPHDLFRKTHRTLCKEGEKWMKETATACMLVATLIATVVFAAGFTLPGGNVSSDGTDKTKVGFPQFRKKFWFDVFIISDSIALLSSVISIVIFLSILTSRYAQDDFRFKLPAKLALGLLALFVSIISMVLGFTAAMILIRDNEPKGSLILIIILASFVAISVTLLHWKLWFETIGHFFKFIFHGRKSGIFL